MRLPLRDTTRTGSDQRPAGTNVFPRESVGFRGSKSHAHVHSGRRGDPGSVRAGRAVHHRGENRGGRPAPRWQAGAASGSARAGTTVTASDWYRLRAGLNCFTVINHQPRPAGRRRGVSGNPVPPGARREPDQAADDAKRRVQHPRPPRRPKGTRELNRDGRFFGLALVVPGYPETVTENLQPGTYWLGDVADTIGAGKPAQLVRLTVLPVRPGPGSWARTSW